MLAALADLPQATFASTVEVAGDKVSVTREFDRLHVFMMKFLRTHCEQRSIEVNRDKPLQAL